MLKITPINLTPLRDITDQLPRTVRKEFRHMVEVDIVKAVQTTLMGRLANTEPPKRTPSSPKFVWSLNKAKNEKARRWWFANVRKGNIPTDGSNHRRTGAIRKSWRAYAVVNTNEATVELQNRAKGVEFVHGSIGRVQVPGHKRTGWANLVDEIAKAQVELDTRINQAADAMIERVDKA